jgi:hypothetical protein
LIAAWIQLAADDGGEFLGLPIPIAVVLIGAVLSGAGALFKHFVLDRRNSVPPQPPVPSQPVLSLRAAANDYVRVLSEVDISSDPEERAAKALTAAASDADEDAPKAAAIALRLARESDLATAKQLAAQLDEALK